GCILSLIGIVKAELFPVNIFALDIALPYTPANSLFGGTAELPGLSFKNTTYKNLLFSYLPFRMALALIMISC
ncbi:MAG: alpha-ketoglutarate permease, partial [Acinetobacter sp.]